MKIWYYGAATSTPTYMQLKNSASGTLTIASFNRFNDEAAVLVFGTVTTSSTAGNIQFQFASNTNGQTSTIYKEGTFLNIK